jgi:hypothetical protein
MSSSGGGGGGVRIGSSDSTGSAATGVGSASGSAERSVFSKTFFGASTRASTAGGGAVTGAGGGAVTGASVGGATGGGVTAAMPSIVPVRPRTVGAIASDVAIGLVAFHGGSPRGTSSRTVRGSGSPSSSHPPSTSSGAAGGGVARSGGLMLAGA